MGWAGLGWDGMGWMLGWVSQVQQLWPGAGASRPWLCRQQAEARRARLTLLPARCAPGAQVAARPQAGGHVRHAGGREVPGLLPGRAAHEGAAALARRLGLLVAAGGWRWRCWGLGAAQAVAALLLRGLLPLKLLRLACIQGAA